MAQYTATRTDGLVGDRGDEHAAAPGRGSWRMRSTPMCTAPMKRIQFCVLGEAPGEVRAAGDDEDHDQGGDGGAGDHERDPRVVDVEQRRLEREADEREERERDEAAQSLDDHRRERDVAGAGGLRGAADAQDVAADGRRQHVAHELAGEVVRRAACAAGRATSNTASTRCQRHAESTKPAKVKRSPAARNASVPAWVSFGWTSSAGSW